MTATGGNRLIVVLLLLSLATIATLFLARLVFVALERKQLAPRPEAMALGADRVNG